MSSSLTREGLSDGDMRRPREHCVPLVVAVSSAPAPLWKSPTPTLARMDSGRIISILSRLSHSTRNME